MKMNYHLRSSSRKGKPGATRIAAIILLVLIFVWLGSFASVGEFALGLARPFWRTGEIVKAGLAVDAGLIQSKQGLILENSALREELGKLNIRLLEFNRVVAENIELKNLLGRQERSRTEILAKVITGPSQSPFDSILLDRGEVDGVKIGDRVSAVGDVPIALVTEIFKNTSRASLFSFPGQTVDVLIGESGIITTATGRGGGNFEAKLPREIEVKIGDSVAIPEISRQVFAVVEDVMLKPTDSFQTIIFKNPVNIAELEWVTVGRSD